MSSRKAQFTAPRFMIKVELLIGPQGRAELAALAFEDQSAKRGDRVEERLSKAPTFLAALWLQWGAGGAGELTGPKDSPAYTLWEAVRPRDAAKSSDWVKRLFGIESTKDQGLTVRTAGPTNGVYKVYVGLKQEVVTIQVACSRFLSGRERENEIPKETWAAAASYLLTGQGEPEWFPIQASAAKSQAETECHLPPLVPLLPPARPAEEFVRLITRLVQRQARVDGCEIEVRGTMSLSQDTHYEAEGWMISRGRQPLFGLAPPVAVNVSWKERQEDIQIIDVQGGGAGRSKARSEPDLKNYVVITPAPRDSEQWATRVQQGARRGITTHNFHQPHIEKWLAACPALLARYYPQAAAGRADAAGFDGGDFAAWRAGVEPKLLRSHRDLQLFGFPPSPRRAAQAPDYLDPDTFRLEDVFVPQALRPRGAKESSDETLESLLGQEAPQVVLIGDPGSGKTSILRYLALVYGEGRKFGARAVKRRLPLFLSLRNFARRRAEEPTLLEALARQARMDASLSEAETHPWRLEGLLELGDAVVFFDGLDEAGDVTSRKDIARFIAQFHESYPLCPIWVTSRIVGYDRAPLAARLFSPYEVLPFSPGQQRAFITRWYDQQLAGDDKVNERQDRVRSLGGYLDGALPDVREMAGNPLLLTLMAWVHHHFGQVPTRRGELFDWSVELFLHRRDKARFPDAPIPLEELVPPIRAETALRYYSGLAYEAQVFNQAKDREARGAIPETALKRWLEQLLGQDFKQAGTSDAEVSNLAAGHAQAFLAFSEARSGLLRDRGGGVWAYVHLAFQEHLAARWVAALLQGKHEKLAGFFHKQAGHEAWAECLLLLLYHLRQVRVPLGGEVDDLSIEGRDDAAFADWLVDRIETGTDPQAASRQWRLLSLAVRDGVQFSPGHLRRILREAVDGWLAHAAFDHESYAALAQIHAYWPDHDPLLLDTISAATGAGSAAGTALAALHLRVRLFGWPADETEAEGLAGQLRDRLGDGLDAALVERAAAVLADAGRGTVAARPAGKALVDFVQGRLLALMTDERRAVKERAASGSALGWLGDPRPGVMPAPPFSAANPLFAWGRELPAVQRFKLGEGPVRDIEAPYRLARYPVTVAQFGLFVAAADGWWNDRWWTEAGKAWKKNKVPARADQPVFETPNHPWVLVSWHEARAFAAWAQASFTAEQLGLDAGWGVRLPTEAEWEYAASAGGRQEYPFQGKPDWSRHGNIGNTGLGHTSAVGLFPAGAATSCGVHDLAGNVWEWCRSRYQDEAKGAEDEEGEGTRVLRGGSWYLDAVLGRAADRHRLAPVPRSVDVGIRVVASPCPLNSGSLVSETLRPEPGGVRRRRGGGLGAQPPTGNFSGRLAGP
jgi:formylglycine-generating enzyme required for sulfatase activity